MERYIDPRPQYFDDAAAGGVAIIPEAEQ